jgi:hypothetical protein
LEDGIGTIKLTNNSRNVLIVYWSLEKNFSDSNPIWEDNQVTLYPGESVFHEMNSAIGIKVYLEDDDGIGWITNESYTVRKDKTVEVKFPTDFSPDTQPLESSS